MCWPCLEQCIPSSKNWPDAPRLPISPKKLQSKCLTSKILCLSNYYGCKPQGSQVISQKKSIDLFLSLTSNMPINLNWAWKLSIQFEATCHFNSGFKTTKHISGLQYSEKKSYVSFNFTNTVVRYLDITFLKRIF